MADFPAKLDEWRVQFRRGLWTLLCFRLGYVALRPRGRYIAAADPVPFSAGRLAQLLEASLTNVEPRQLVHRWTQERWFSDFSTDSNHF